MADEIRYTFNSMSSKAPEAPAPEPEHKFKPVVDEKPGDKDSNSFGKKFLRLFISDDAKDIKGYLLKEVVVPTIKNTISDVVNMTLGLGSSRSSTGRLPFERIAYGSFYKGASSATRAVDVPENRSPEDRALCFKSRKQAELVLASAQEALEVYNTLSLNEFYELANREDLCSISGANYGWKSLHAAKIMQSGRDWVVAMPKLYPLR